MLIYESLVTRRCMLLSEVKMTDVANGHDVRGCVMQLCKMVWVDRLELHQAFESLSLFASV